MGWLGMGDGIEEGRPRVCQMITPESFNKGQVR